MKNLTTAILMSAIIAATGVAYAGETCEWGFRDGQQSDNYDPPANSSERTYRRGYIQGMKKASPADQAYRRALEGGSCDYGCEPCY